MYTYCTLLCKTLLFARNKVDCDVGKSHFMNAECFSSVPPQSLPFLHPMPLTLGPKGGGGKNAWQHIFWEMKIGVPSIAIYVTYFSASINQSV